MHPMLQFDNPRLFEANADGIILNDCYRKGGCSKLTLTKEINLPQLTKTQRIACGILFAQQVCKDEEWNTWATNWLNGTDRTRKSAVNTSGAVDAAITTGSDNVAGYVACSIYHSIGANPDTFTLERIISLINKALEYK